MFLFIFVPVERSAQGTAGKMLSHTVCDLDTLSPALADRETITNDALGRILSYFNEAPALTQPPLTAQLFSQPGFSAAV